MSLAVPKNSNSFMEKIFSEQGEKLSWFVPHLYENSPFYRRKLGEAGIDPYSVRTVKDLEQLPFTTKEELRTGYPLGLMAVPEEQVVRIHSSSGTTGKPVIVPYTANDVATWAEMMARCMALTGVTSRDRVQVTPGYGLWTAGIGFQAGVERLGAMAIPTGPGNTEKQIEMMLDLKTTVLCSTSSYALLLAEEIHKRGLLDRISLRLGIIGSERWGDKMRARIEEMLGIETFDIYGLTEIYGPGTSIDCPEHCGLHYWHEHLLFEVIDPSTGKQLPPGVEGELVVTTLTKEGMPLLRYRTRDITRILPDRCPCGSPYPMHARILGRTDDMIKIKGVNIYPGQVDHVLKITDGAGSEYQIIVARDQGKDNILVKVEGEQDCSFEEVADRLRKNIKTRVGILADVEVVPHGSLPRSEKKSKRVFDYRDC
ncbi:Phenylacetate-coenzyme A ligase [Pelotomaculum propionicicum]|uniref:Phenylacetate-coenzyme A ligase n=2 Tax=Pelotomaculum propionicicum TaxID=258475 RepID=A0A4Y7RSX5_9FIRM|nr:phenylacetate--CoA ligase [Pelotomaculum propionicicum]NLI13043.1 phenylacetate--CoA ligase [Peptococcaceae bacterium]TEB11856.1 Phenylacetate-coenzyme A ligase [Pelotomaculum propionicicum]